MQKTLGDIDKAFELGNIFSASNEDLVEYLQVLNSESILNEATRSRAINRCITINTLINLRFIKSVERRDTILTWVVITLAALTLASSIIQIFK